MFIRMGWGSPYSFSYVLYKKPFVLSVRTCKPTCVRAYVYLHTKVTMSDHDPITDISDGLEVVDSGRLLDLGQDLGLHKHVCVRVRVRVCVHV